MRILIVDDQRNMRATLGILLRGAGYETDEAPDGETAVEKVGQESFDLVLTDLRMGRVDGMEVLRKVRESSPTTEVIVMTAYGTVESAVAAMRLGAYDYLQKPFTEEELLVKVDKAFERKRLTNEVTLLSQEFRERYKFENLIGRSQAIRDVLSRIIRIAPTDATVLITGPSGTGKELVAKAIHANSRRSDRPFVPVNCAAIHEQLLESELFGHMRGAFTGAVATRRGLIEEADGGTFFFDEIAETTLAFQAKLLRTIQEGEIRRVGDNRSIKVDVRVIAATNQDLQKAIAEKRFRQDLFYRLNVARFHLPPLRERPEDIQPLVEHFMARAQARMQKPVRLGPGVMQFLLSYDYPGNVRELENLIEQGVALAAGGVVRLSDIEVKPEAAPTTGGQTLADVVASAERQAILSTIADTRTLADAAKALGLSTTTLWRKMRRHGITRFAPPEAEPLQR
ncbi:MAG: sigma-54-dependent Fis family transcriptional regulator [Myxococcales bacterium]|nr:sigma-54-dependent Fis family transcriptional regulator [Myxococcales bacterium]